MKLEFPIVLKKLEVMPDDEFFAFCRANDPLELERDNTVFYANPIGRERIARLYI